jgi:hypothetical protein
MKINNLKLDKKKMELNLLFYSLLKELNSVKPHVTSLSAIKEILYRYIDDIDQLQSQLDILIEALLEKDKYKTAEMLEIYKTELSTKTQVVAFQAAIKLYEVKGVLLEETKLHFASQAERLHKLPLLSLKYDSYSKAIPYSKRVSGALLTSIFFEKILNSQKDFLSEISEEFVNELVKECLYLQKEGIDLDNMYSLMFQESINQSIKSTAGGSYEDRITQYLISIGIPKDSIEKVHDSEDKAFEIDHKITLDGKVVAISAKRTLRERYKQFIKTIQSTDNYDLFFTITLGTDLTKEKAESIRAHDVYVFIADEIYLQKKYLSKIEGIYPISSLKESLIRSLLK